MRLNLRTDKWNPNVRAQANHIVAWMAGLQFEFPGNVELQVNYELTQRCGQENENLWLTQLKWGW